MGLTSLRQSKPVCWGPVQGVGRASSGAPCTEPRGKLLGCANQNLMCLTGPGPSESTALGI